MPLELAFETFASQPIAAASLGQAYRATLSPSLAEEWGAKDVVVKVLRPGIEEVVDVDLKALRRVARWLARIKLVNRRTDAPALVEEFAQVSLEEIDYFVEAANLSRFADNFAESTRISTPEIIWERSSKKVLTLSDVSGIKVSDVGALIASGTDPNAVAGELATATFEQIFVHGFFHADPHPGNIFVNVNPEVAGDFKLSFIDFGMMGEISDDLRQGLQSLIFALVARDARHCVAAMQRLELLLPSADTVELERAVGVVFDRFGGVGVAELTKTDPREIKELIVQFSELVRQLPFQLPEDFLMLLRAVSLISGVTSSLNRDFNMWDAVDPFARSLLNGGSNPTLKAAGREVLNFGATVAGLPKRLDSVLGLMDQGKLAVRLPEVERAVRRLDGTVRRVISAIAFLGLLGAGVALRLSHDQLGDVLLIVAIPFALHAIGFLRIK
jgi:predicted unusual protein kinase regulating ubiquinone biosynthesis (AarF/ABC1/UbiB family)